MTARTITVDVNDDGGPTWVYFRGGAHSFDLEPDALAFVARRQLADPDLEVKVRAR